MNDIVLCIIGSKNENELVLASILHLLYDVYTKLFKVKLSKRIILENFDYFSLVLDETIDNGIIVQFNSCKIVEKVETLMKEYENLKLVNKLEKTIKSMKKSKNISSFIENSVIGKFLFQNKSITERNDSK